MDVDPIPTLVPDENPNPDACMAESPMLVSMFAEDDVGSAGAGLYGPDEDRYAA
jgi:hypothetical protein